MSSPAIEKGHRAGQAPASAGKRYPAEILTTDEVRALIAARSKRAPTGVRDRALLFLLYRGDLRISEALALSRKRSTPPRAPITVLHGKGRSPAHDRSRRRRV